MMKRQNLKSWWSLTLTTSIEIFADADVPSTLTVMLMSLHQSNFHLVYIMLLLSSKDADPFDGEK